MYFVAKTSIKIDFVYNHQSLHFSLKHHEEKEGIQIRLKRIEQFRYSVTNNFFSLPFEPEIYSSPLRTDKFWFVTFYLANHRKYCRSRCVPLCVKSFIIIFKNYEFLYSTFELITRKTEPEICLADERFVPRVKLLSNFDFALPLSLVFVLRKGTCSYI